MRAIGKHKPTDMYPKPLGVSQLTTQKTFRTTLGLAALLSSSLALADHDHKGHKHGGPRQDVVALEQSKISAAQAIAIAEKDTNATADNLDLELHRGSAVYEIDLHDDKQEYEIRVDAITGEITKRQSEYEDDLPRRGTITITQAIETAERETGAKVVEADLDGKRSGLVYEIELIGSDGSRLFADISADDGKILRSGEKKRPPHMGMKDGNNPPPPPPAEAPANTPAAQ